ncbi:MAG: tetratricopeptide repeat protein, partial [Bacteroidota bacterium]
MDHLSKDWRFNFSWYLIVLWLILTPFSIQSQSSLITQEKRAKRLIHQRQFDAALEVYDQILAKSRKEEDLDVYYYTITQKVLLYQRLNQYEPAFQLVEEAITAHQLLLPDTIHTKIGQLYHLQSSNTHRLGNFKASINWANRAINIFEKLEEPTNAAKAQLNIALCYFNQNEASKSIQLLEEALATLSIHEDAHPQQLGETLFYLGIVHKHQYHLDIAIDYFRRALPYSIEAKDSMRIGYAYNNLGIALGQQYDFQEGLEHCIKALDIFSAFFGRQHPSVGYAYNGIGNSYYEQGKFQAAYEYYKLGFQHFKNLFGLESINTTGLLMNMGLMLQEMGAFEEALKTYQKVVAIQARTTETDYDNFKVHRNIGLTYLQLGDSLRAKQKFEYTLSIGDQFLADNSMDWVSLFLDLARIADSVEQAKKWTQRAFQIFYEEKSSPLVLEEEDFEFALQRFALFKVIHAFTQYEWQLFKQEKGAKLLDTSYQLAVKGIEFADYIWRHQRTEESKLEFIKLARNHIETTIQISRAIYEIRADSSILNDLFRLIEKHKALLLAEAIEDRNIKFDLGIPDSLLRKEKRLSRLIFEEQKRLLEEKSDAPPLKDSTTYYNILFQKKEELSRLQQSIASNYPKYYQLKYDDAPLSIAVIQHNLSDEELLIDYLFDAHGLSIFTIHKKRVFYHYQPIEKDKLNQQISQFQA